MKRTLLVAAGLAVVAAVLLAVAAPALASPLPFAFPRNAMAPPGPDPIDGTYMLGSKDTAMRKAAARLGPKVATGALPTGAPATVGEEITVTVSDDGLNVDYPETFVVVKDGVNGIILVTKDAYTSFDGTYYHFANPYGDGSSPWARTEDLISPAQLDYMLNQFDTNIYPKDTAVYGEPLPRGAEGQKVWILIHNIRDGAYYDPFNEDTYIAGYFSSSEDATNNRNMMHIDTYDWANRTGAGSDRPYLYEGVFAHEFEHLIHFDADPDEESWVDEGLADLAQYVCGYGHDAGHIAYYLVYHPMTSLTFWGGGLESYGASYLFQLYLWEHFGGNKFVTALVKEQANGIDGIVNTLRKFGYKNTFDQVFDNWTIANYVDDAKAGTGGAYGYRTLDFGGADTWGYTIPYSVANFWWGPDWGLPSVPLAAPFVWSPLDWVGADVQPYTAHYYPYQNSKVVTEGIKGDTFAGVPPHGGTYEWYSGAISWAWRSISRTFTIPAGGATLDFWTWFDIESDWDYGYVEVYDRSTGLWSTLDASGTVSNVAHVQDNPNTPADREPSAYEADGNWHAFTGSSGGWMPVSMDLTPFAGHDIDLYFTTWQDGAYSLQMMYVDDISVTGTGLSFADGAEAGINGWTVTPNGWYITDGKFPNMWAVKTLDTKRIPLARFPAPAGNNAQTLRSIITMKVDPASGSGTVKIPATPASSGRTQVAIVTNHAGHILMSNYDFWTKFQK
jgi:hypothetical protein